MAVIDTSIPFAGRPPQIVNALALGSQAAAQRNELARANALAQLYQTQGADIAAGNQGALNALAQFDPMAALGIQDTRQGMDARALSMDATRLGMDATRQDMDLQLREWAASMDERERAARLQEGQAVMARIINATTPQAFDALMIEMGKPEMVGQFGRRGEMISNMRDPLDVLAQYDAQNAARQEAKIETKAQNGFNPERYRVVDGNLVDLMAPTGPAAVDFGGQPGGPSTVINNNMPDPTGGVTDNFYEKLDTAQAEMFGALLNQGMTAPARLAQIDELDRLLQASPSGLEGAIVQWLGNRGIPTEGMDTVQAASALINRLIPAQRPPGSGPMSDRDVQMFMESLPRIINTPGGNQLITSVMRGLVVYEQQQAEIANRVASREITPAQGRELLMALENPLQVFRTTDEAVTIQGGDWQDVGDGIQMRRID